MIRKTPAAASSPDGIEAAADLVRLVPDNAGVYQAKAQTSADSCFDLLESKLLAPHLGPAPPSQIAPHVQLTSGETGGSSDLETRIDQSPAQRPVAPQSTSALKDLLDKTQILASLQMQSTERDKAGVFVRTHSGVALLAASDWNETGVQSALADFVRPGLTASQLGVVWQQESGYQKFDGLWPLVVSVRGKYLLVSDDPALMSAMLSNLDRKSAVKPAIFLAGFKHSRERANFARFFGLVDRPDAAQSDVPGIGRQPQFFSDNITGLSATLADVAAEHIAMRTDGAKVLQTVTYEWSQ